MFAFMEPEIDDANFPSVIVVSSVKLQLIFKLGGFVGWNQILLALQAIRRYNSLQNNPPKGLTSKNPTRCRQA